MEDLDDMLLEQQLGGVGGVGGVGDGADGEDDGGALQHMLEQGDDDDDPSRGGGGGGGGGGDVGGGMIDGLLEHVEQLRHAMAGGELDAVSRALDSGDQTLDVNVVGEAGRTPLLLAAGSGRVPVIRQLLTAGADKHAVDVIGWGVLHHAANGGVRRRGHCAAQRVTARAD